MTEGCEVLKRIGVFKDIPEERLEFACQSYSYLFEIWELNPDLDEDIALFSGSLSKIISKTTNEFDSVELYQRWIEFKNSPSAQSIKSDLVFGNVDWECEVMYMFREYIIDEINGVIKNDI